VICQILNYFFKNHVFKSHILTSFLKSHFFKIVDPNESLTWYNIKVEGLKFENWFYKLTLAHLIQYSMRQASTFSFFKKNNISDFINLKKLSIKSLYIQSTRLWQNNTSDTLKNTIYPNPIRILFNHATKLL
jgi:hypothetical protein